ARSRPPRQSPTRVTLARSSATSLSTVHSRSGSARSSNRVSSAQTDGTALSMKADRSGRSGSDAGLLTPTPQGLAGTTWRRTLAPESQMATQEISGDLGNQGERLRFLAVGSGDAAPCDNGSQDSGRTTGRSALLASS